MHKNDKYNLQKLEYSPKNINAYKYIITTLLIS